MASGSGTVGTRVARSAAGIGCPNPRSIRWSTRLRSKPESATLYVHAGPLLDDGSIEDSADPLFAALRSAYPEGVFLAWLGARIEKVRLGEDEWRRAVVGVVERLAEEGFDGVHFNLEPIRDGHPGYLELLSQVRASMGDAWTISQATPRSAPFGISVGPLRKNFWSGAFYRATMDIADQTVLMAYDTNLPLRVAYAASSSETRPTAS